MERGIWGEKIARKEQGGPRRVSLQTHSHVGQSKRQIFPFASEERFCSSSNEPTTNTGAVMGAPPVLFE